METIHIRVVCNIHMYTVTYSATAVPVLTSRTFLLQVLFRTGNKMSLSSLENTVYQLKFVSKIFVLVMLPNNDR